MTKAKALLNSYFRVNLPVLILFILLRVYEYYMADIKLDLSSSLWLDLLRCLLFDITSWFVYCCFLLIPYSLLYLWKEKAAQIFIHSANVLTTIGFFGLIFVFAERTVPFDHELFVRTFSETTSTVTEVITGRFWTVLPIIAYLLIYVGLSFFFSRTKRIGQKLSVSLCLLSAASIPLQGIILPAKADFSHIQDYYFVTNKLYYFTADSYSFFRESDISKRFENKGEVLNEIAMYEKNNPFRYVDKEYPLLRIDESKNVLKNFFRKSDTIPNIVIIIYEGLSRDFSGYDAEAGSFTPFLDSLAEHSLAWQNCLSSADGTFGSLPAIIGSLPFGKRGFTQQANPVEHISLVKILKKNNYNAFYFAGGEINYDNFGGFMGLQGVDYMSVEFGKKYKKMGIGPEGWSAGFPDDALYNRSLEMLDMIGQQPYIAVYLTLTTHSPFIFDQQKQYFARFDRELKARNLSESTKKQLGLYKPMLSSFLYSDDCMREYFRKFKQRPEFKNTIFVITGDHHHGFYPTRNIIDDYNVPLVIYSPMLKKSVRFQSVNAHINIAPTLLAYLKDSYKLKYFPRYVSWVGDELDTCRTFRNIHHIPFMLTNRNIEDYLYGDYYIANNNVYKLKPGLNLEEINNDTLLTNINRKRENFKFINAYVCQHNKLFPKTENIYDSKATELFSVTETDECDIKSGASYYEKVAGFKPPADYKKIMVRITFEAKFDTADFDMLPLVATSIYDNKEQLMWQGHDINEYVPKPQANNVWTLFSNEDVFNLNNFANAETPAFRIEIWNKFKIKMKFKQFSIKFLGIK